MWKKLRNGLNVSVENVTKCAQFQCGKCYKMGIVCETFLQNWHRVTEQCYKVDIVC